MKDQDFIQASRERLAASSADEVLQWAAEAFAGPVKFASSLGAEDQVITHALALNHLPIPIFMLDTGRHFEETYQLLEETQRRYNTNIRLYFPDGHDVEEATNREGPNFFRGSIEGRKHCCFIRKVKPLRRALRGCQAWITGLRREQSQTRQEVAVIEWDEGNGLYKINPLWNWHEARVWEHIREHAIPYNALHDRDFPSIGCAPCTRAVAPGEDARAGRWWWESPQTKECGLHLVGGRALQRKSATREKRVPIPV